MYFEGDLITYSVNLYTLQKAKQCVTYTDNSTYNQALIQRFLNFFCHDPLEFLLK